MCIRMPTKASTAVGIICYANICSFASLVVVVSIPFVDVEFVGLSFVPRWIDVKLMFCM